MHEEAGVAKVIALKPGPVRLEVPPLAMEAANRLEHEDKDGDPPLSPHPTTPPPFPLHLHPSLSLGAEREVALIKLRETIRTSLNQRGAKVTLGLRCCI